MSLVCRIPPGQAQDPSHPSSWGQEQCSIVGPKWDGAEWPLAPVQWAGLPAAAPGSAVPASMWPLRLSCQESLPPASTGMKAQQEGGCR